MKQLTIVNTALLIITGVLTACNSTNVNAELTKEDSTVASAKKREAISIEDVVDSLSFLTVTAPIIPSLPIKNGQSFFEVDTSISKTKILEQVYKYFDTDSLSSISYPGTLPVHISTIDLKLGECGVFHASLILSDSLEQGVIIPSSLIKDQTVYTELNYFTVKNKEDSVFHRYINSIEFDTLGVDSLMKKYGWMHPRWEGQIFMNAKKDRVLFQKDLVSPGCEYDSDLASYAMILSRKDNGWEQSAWTKLEGFESSSAFPQIQGIIEYKKGWRLVWSALPSDPCIENPRSFVQKIE